MDWTHLPCAKIPSVPVRISLEQLMKRTVEVDRVLALIGAATRVKELSAEIKRICSMFPELGRHGQSREAVSKGGRRKRAFSAAAKRRMSAGMRKYWARRKAVGATKGTRPAASAKA